MNKPLTPDEIAQCLSPVEITVKKPPPMTRREKLQRLAQAVRSASDGVVIFHKLEYKSVETLGTCIHPRSAFQLALADPVLRNAGLKTDCSNSYVSVLEAQRFFELSRDELHEFSCDCGGAISNANMADRIEKIAVVGPTRSFLSRVFDPRTWTGRYDGPTIP